MHEVGKIFRRGFKAMSVTVLIEVIATIVGMIFLCYFTSGIANISGSIFEKKSTVVKNNKR